MTRKRLREVRVPTVPPVRANGASASAGGLGGTLAFAPFVMREQDLGYDPAHPRPPIALIQIGLWGILQHLKHKKARMKTVGTGLDCYGHINVPAPSRASVED